MSIPFRPAILSALTAAAVAALGCSVAPNSAYAAGMAGAQEGSRAAEASERARQRREKRGESGSKKNDETEQRYPNATRESPSGKSGSKGSKLLNAMQKDVEAEKWQDVLTAADSLPADLNPYEKAFAYTFAANAATKVDRMDLAETYFARVVESDAMANNDHYQAMLNLAVVRNQLDKKQEAFATIDRFLKETGSEDRDHLNFRAVMLIELDRPAEAAAMYDTLLVKYPDDKAIMTNALAMHSQAGNDARVTELLNQARRKNMLSEPAEYRNLYRPMIRAGNLTEAVELIDEAVTKGIVKQDESLSDDYQAIAESAYFEKNDTEMAIRYYQRAETLSKKGLVSLNLAKLLFNDGRLPEARQAAQRALDKGIPKPEEARRIINAK